MATRTDNMEIFGLRARQVPSAQPALFVTPSPVAAAYYYANAWAWRRW